MTNKTTSYRATFSNGLTLTRTTRREYGVAWAFFDKATGDLLEKGFARDESVVPTHFLPECQRGHMAKYNKANQERNRHVRREVVPAELVK